jgi:diguanylate cyclase (GGDEF)-like protein
LEFDNDNVNELKKNMPNLEQFLENINTINTRCNENESVSILRIDISHFKQVNDDYGYDRGDRVILVLYKILQASIEGFGNKVTIGRMGGDEFAIFANVDKSVASQISENIISKLKEFEFGTIGCPKKIGCYIGVLVGKCLDMKTIRKMLDDTIETINKARKEGTNSIFIEDFNQ